MGTKGFAVVTCSVLFGFALACLSSCGGGMTTNAGNGGNNPPGGGSPSVPSAPTTGNVAVTISDPSVCSSAAGGPFQHIYVTVTDVVAYASASMPLNGGVDLTPGLAQSPMQIDLLGTPASGCTLATLGSSASVPQGTYEGIQVFLAGSDQVSKISGGTKCGSTFAGVPANCAVLADGSVIDLDPTTTGSYPSAVRIIGGQVTLGSGQQVLNIDFDSCASMVYGLTGGNYGLDPTMHAALMSGSGSISGKVLNASTQQPIAGDVIVALEQGDNLGVDREIMQVAPGSDGSFVLCPVPPGTYDVVAIGLSATGTSFATSVTLGVQPGASLGNLALQPVVGANHAVGQLVGQVTATGPEGLGGYTHIVISALQSISANGTTLVVTIPLPGQYTTGFRTFVTSTMNYQLAVPAANALAGVFVVNSGTQYQNNMTGPANYEVDVQSSCNPAVVRSSSAVSVSPGNIATVPTIALVSCPPA